MKRSEPIHIIGGGIAGLTTALALKTVGIKYNLFEQCAEISYENVGLGISANVFHILEEWNILKETKEIGTEIRHFHFVDKRLNQLKSFKLQRPALSIKRKLFYQLLKERLDNESIHLNSNKSVHDFSEGDVVISAEGIHSKTRQEMYPNLKIRNANQILWRGISEICLDEKFKNAYYDFVGNNLRFGIVHTGGDFYSWYIIKEKTENEKMNLDKEILKTLFKDYHEIVNQVIDKSEGVYFSELMDLNPMDRKNLNWFTNKKIMIGDAIHPTTPNLANGACLAMEDSYLLVNLLNDDCITLQEVFETFQKQRTKKVNGIVFQSWWLGKLLHQKNNILDNFIKFGITLTPKFLFDKMYSSVLIETNADIQLTKTNNRNG